MATTEWGKGRCQCLGCWGCAASLGRGRKKVKWTLYTAGQQGQWVVLPLSLPLGSHLDSGWGLDWGIHVLVLDQPVTPPRTTLAPSPLYHPLLPSMQGHKLMNNQHRL